MTEKRVITVGVDGSETSSTAAFWAAREAARRGATLRVINAFTVPVYVGSMSAAVAVPVVDRADLETSHSRMVDAQLAPLREAYPTVAMEVRVVQGPAAGAIVDASQDAELTVVGTRGAGSLAAVFVGSVARGVAHRSTGPVVLVPDQAPAGDVRRIVVGVDSSPASEAALDWAMTESRLWDAELTVAHAWSYPYGRGALGMTEYMATDARDELAHVMSRIDEPERDTVRSVLLRGAPAAALADEAVGHDMLVIGCRGFGAIKSALLGSTTNQLVHHAPVVLVVIHAHD